MMEKEQWTSIITPRHRWYDIDLKGLWRYRDLYRMYVRRDIVVVYKQTILGPLWFVIQPIFTTIMYMFVFGGLAGISTDGMPQPLFYMSGIMLWNYFSSVFSATSGTFVGNAGVFGKVYFPRLIVPLSVTTSNLLKFLIQFLLFAAIWIYFYATGANVHLTWGVLIFPLVILLTAIMSMSLGLITSSMTTKYRDLNQLVGFGVSLFMYATPVIYPLSAAPEKYRQIIELNPLAPLFESLRYGFMGTGSIMWGGLLYSAIVALVMLTIAVVVFSKTERTFMDTV